MSHQFVYTSVPSGLKPGSQGYCMVAATQGLPQNLASQLESLSGYKHLYKPNDPNNPVGYGHVVLRVSGKLFNVVSRVADAGLDYTNRSNLIAHHIALESGELPEGGPAWMLGPQQRNYFTEWSGDPRQLPAYQRSPGGDHAAVCTAWKAASGYAGWGGVLAESALSAVPGKVAIVYPPGLKLLPLLRESMALLPANVRWRVNFNTYFTQLLPGQECHWRFIPVGTPQAKKLSGMTVIDLTKRNAPPAGAGEDAAERGMQLGAAPSKVAPSSPHIAGPQPSGTTAAAVGAAAGARTDPRRGATPPIPEGSPLVGSGAPPKRTTPPRRGGGVHLAGASGNEPGVTLKGRKSQNKSSGSKGGKNLGLIIFLILFLFLPVAGGLTWWTWDDIKSSIMPDGEPIALIIKEVKLLTPPDGESQLRPQKGKVDVCNISIPKDFEPKKFEPIVLKLTFDKNIPEGYLPKKQESKHSFEFVQLKDDQTKIKMKMGLEGFQGGTENLFKDQIHIKDANDKKVLTLRFLPKQDSNSASINLAELTSVNGISVAGKSIDSPIEFQEDAEAATITLGFDQSVSGGNLKITPTPSEGLKFVPVLNQSSGSNKLKYRLESPAHFNTEHSEPIDVNVFLDGKVACNFKLVITNDPDPPVLKGQEDREAWTAKVGDSFREKIEFSDPDFPKSHSEGPKIEDYTFKIKSEQDIFEIEEGCLIVKPTLANYLDKQELNLEITITEREDTDVDTSDSAVPVASEPLSHSETYVIRLQMPDNLGLYKNDSLDLAKTFLDGGSEKDTELPDLLAGQDFDLALYPPCKTYGIEPAHGNDKQWYVVRRFEGGEEGEGGKSLKLIKIEQGKTDGALKNKLIWSVVEEQKGNPNLTELLENYLRFAFVKLSVSKGSNGEDPETLDGYLRCDEEAMGRDICDGRMLAYKIFNSRKGKWGNGFNKPPIVDDAVKLRSIAFCAQFFESGIRVEFSNAPRKTRETKDTHGECDNRPKDSVFCPDKNASDRFEITSGKSGPKTVSTVNVVLNPYDTYLDFGLDLTWQLKHNKKTKKLEINGPNSSNLTFKTEDNSRFMKGLEKLKILIAEGDTPSKAFELINNAIKKQSSIQDKFGFEAKKIDLERKRDKQIKKIKSEFKNNPENTAKHNDIENVYKKFDPKIDTEENLIRAVDQLQEFVGENSEQSKVINNLAFYYFIYLEYPDPRNENGSPVRYLIFKETN